MSSKWYEERLRTYIRLDASNAYTEDQGLLAPLEGPPEILAMAYLVRRLTRQLIEGVSELEGYQRFAGTARLQEDARNEFSEKADDAMFFFEGMENDGRGATDLVALRFAVNVAWMRDSGRLAKDWQLYKVKPLPKRRAKQ